MPMQPATLTLRPETPTDYAEVENLTREAFWNSHSPGCDEHYLAHLMRVCPAFVPELDYVAVQSGRIVGSIFYTRARVVRDDGSEQAALCFGPISVLPSCQRQGVGTQLIRHTSALARTLGYAAILIYGDPAYYSRQGFVPAETFGIATPGNLYHEALQAMELQPGALGAAGGRFFEDSVFELDPDASEAFDRSFPPKRREEGIPSQLRFQEILRMVKPRT